MQKVTITLSCSDNPLDEKLFEGKKVYEIEVLDPHDTDNLINEI